MKKQWIMIAILLAAVCFWGPLAIFATTKKCSLGYTTCDFYAYYLAGKSYLLGLSPYNAIPQQLLLEYTIDTTFTYSWFIYPPTLLPFWAVFALLPYKDAQIVWLFLNCIMGLGTVATIYGHLPESKRIPWVVLLSLLFMFSAPLLIEISWGNINFFISCLMAVSFVMYKKNKTAITAILLAIASLLKVYPGFYLMILVFVYRDRKLLKQFIFFILIGISLSCLFIPWQLYIQYLGETLPRIAVGSTTFDPNQSFLDLFGVTGSGGELIFMGSLLTGVFYILSQIRLKLKLQDRKSSVNQALYYALGCSIALCISGYVWPHTFVILLFPLSILIPEILEATPKIRILFLFASILTQAPWFNYIIINKINALGNLVLLSWLIIVMVHPKLLHNE